MKKVLILTLAMVMLISLAACGGASEEVSLVDVTTEQGITLKLPSDLTLQTVQDKVTYLNSETGDNAAFGASEVGETPLSAWTEENILATYQASYPDAAVQSFENGVDINGSEALVSTVTLTSPKGAALTIALVMITDGTTNYIVNFTYSTDDEDSSLAKNLQACIDSIIIPAA